MRPVHPLVPLAFLMAALAVVQAYFLLLLGTYGVLSADNIDTVLFAWQWARKPAVFISDSGRLPFYFWVYGAVLRFHDEIRYYPEKTTYLMEKPPTRLPTCAA